MGNLSNDGHPNIIREVKELGWADEQIAEEGQHTRYYNDRSLLNTIWHLLNQYARRYVKHRQNREEHSDLYLREVVVFDPERQNGLHETV